MGPQTDVIKRRPVWKNNLLLFFAFWQLPSLETLLNNFKLNNSFQQRNILIKTSEAGHKKI